jgi:type II secretory pathway component PulF
MTQAAAEPKERSKFWRVMSAVAVALGGLVWLWPLSSLVWVVPHFEGIFKRFDIKGGLPALTQAEIEVSHVLVKFWYLFGPAWLAGIVGLAIWCYRTPSRRGGNMAWVFALASVPLAGVFNYLITLGVFQPLADLIQALSGRC